MKRKPPNERFKGQLVPQQSLLGVRSTFKGQLVPQRSLLGVRSVKTVFRAVISGPTGFLRVPSLRQRSAVDADKAGPGQT